MTAHGKHWKLIKIGATLVRHSKHATFHMAEVAVLRELYAAIVDRIQRFGVPPLPGEGGWRSRPVRERKG